MSVPYIRHRTGFIRQEDRSVARQVGPRERINCRSSYAVLRVMVEAHERLLTRRDLRTCAPPRMLHRMGKHRKVRCASGAVRIETDSELGQVASPDVSDVTDFTFDERRYVEAARQCRLEGHQNALQRAVHRLQLLKDLLTLFSVDRSLGGGYPRRQLALIPHPAGESLTRKKRVNPQSSHRFRRTINQLSKATTIIPSGGRIDEGFRDVVEGVVEAHACGIVFDGDRACRPVACIARGHDQVGRTEQDFFETNTIAEESLLRYLDGL
ncbi:hypothetical protein FOZ60_000423 [Perkinsus olseni]|uniref:Uncharacterized protein n=1 Tax=Perkinsus olseni TaxID=32597 RepID=A0A7J6P3G7_PEROL|nr:hypothetical protein FOZ60_000423 [Perkinsus olseni]